LRAVAKRNSPHARYIGGYMMDAFRNPALSAHLRAKDLLPRLSITEKVGQLNQRLYGFGIYERSGEDFTFTEEFENELARWGGLGVLYGLFRADPWSGRTADTGIPAHRAAKVYNLVQRKVIEASRWGIPALMSTECPHGHQALDGYLLPVCLAMGATFAPDLVHSAFGVVAEQIRAQGIDFALISVLDVLRDPRWGRSEECFGEDPFLCSVMASAAVKGCTEHGTYAVAKHLCAQGETTGGLNASAASIGKRELLEIHLPPAQAAVQAGAAGFMAAYNEIDGVPCHANSRLLRDTLRDEWGFGGVVMADGTATDRLDIITGDNMASGATALAAGVDISLWDEAFTKLEKAVSLGLVDESALDEAVLRVLTLKFERGLFESAYLDESVPAQEFTIEKYPQSLELARHSPVLLKNENNLLPLAENIRKIAVIGPAADDLYLQLGDYTPPVNAGCATTLWDGLRQLATPGTKLMRATGCSLRDGSDREIDEAVALANQADVVILALGGSSSRYLGARFDINGAVIHDGEVYMDCGEGVDSSSLLLPGLQHELAKALFETGVPIVTVIIAGRPYALPDIDCRCHALIYSFYPGPWGGKAIAELLFGITAPAGRLPASLPRSPGQLPCYYNRKATDAEQQYCDLSGSPLYAFGHGLSYTSFDISDVAAEQTTDLSVSVSFSIANTGQCGGYAVAMLFIRWLRGDVTPRVKELKAFSKVWLLPGERKVVALMLGAAELSRLGLDMRRLPGKGLLRLILEEGGAEFWRDELLIE